MKKVFMACALILSLCYLGGCSKDDEAGSGSSKVKGSVEIEGNKFDVKYGYKIYDDEDYTTEYAFYDKDMLKYVGEETPNVEFSAIVFFSEENSVDIIEAVGIAYKTNYYNETGLGYETEYDEVDFYDYGNFSDSKGKVKCSAKKLPMYGFDWKNENDRGQFYANFSIEGSVKNLSDLFEDNTTRGIEVKEVTNPKEVAFLKQLMPKRSGSKK
ncbi:MAG: hypothetical protein K2K25_10720 [Muribaculaceae bacterium]|nr:hypothetical protein [Muribaculaceae bacterium]